MAKGKAKNQKDTDSTYTNTGGFQFTLPDEVRLKNKSKALSRNTLFVERHGWILEAK